MKYILTTICAAFLTISAGAQTTEVQTEVTEYINDGKSTIIFAVPNNELKNDLDDLFAAVKRDHAFISGVEINPETNNIQVKCKRDIGLVEVSELMKEFRISRYHYNWEVDTAEL